MGGFQGDLPPSTPLFLDQTEAQRADKIVSEIPPPPPPRFFSQGLDDQAQPYLKVLIGHC